MQESRGNTSWIIPTLSNDDASFAPNYYAYFAPTASQVMVISVLKIDAVPSGLGILFHFEIVDGHPELA